jgi:hypothetical protein
LERLLKQEGLRRSPCGPFHGSTVRLVLTTIVARMELLHAVVVLNLASTLVLVGMIWTVQIVHYPLMAHVGRESFVAYESAHAPRMASIVMLPWALEGITTAWLLIDRPASVGVGLVWSGAAAASLTVLVTIIWSVPAHGQLRAGFDADIHARLVATNWIRTIGWTAHAAIALSIAARTFSV